MEPVSLYGTCQSLWNLSVSMEPASSRHKMEPHKYTCAAKSAFCASLASLLCVMLTRYWTCVRVCVCVCVCVCVFLRSLGRIAQSHQSGNFSPEPFSTHSLTAQSHLQTYQSSPQRAQFHLATRSDFPICHSVTIYLPVYYLSPICDLSPSANISSSDSLSR
jgi:hypothetical protein